MIICIVPVSDDLFGRMVMAPSAAHSWWRTGWILAPQESEPIQWKKPDLPARTVAERSFLEKEAGTVFTF